MFPPALLGIKTLSVALASGSPKMKIEQYARFDYLREKKTGENILKRSTSNGKGENFILSVSKATCLGNLCKTAEYVINFCPTGRWTVSP